MKIRILFLLPLSCLCWVTHLQAQLYVNFTHAQPAQLNAAAGADHLICPGDTALIGDNPAANGGTSPFTYTWSPSTGLSTPDSAQTNAFPFASTVYALSVTDARGCTQTDSVLVEIDVCAGLRDQALITSMLVFPNPSDGAFTLYLQLGQLGTNMSLSVTDLLGRVHWRKTLKDCPVKVVENVPLLSLSPGTYFVRAEVGGKQVTRKVIIH